MLPLAAISGRARLFPALFLALLLCVPSATTVPAAAQSATDNPSGLPLPRFVTTRSHPINVRVGPGTKYDIAWNFLVSGVPVEIIQEFDTWRKIRDFDGAEGWVHQSLLDGSRAGYATPLVANGEVEVHADPSDQARLAARLAAGARVSISACENSWCKVSASQPGERTIYSGWVHQAELWGVYPEETFD